MATRGNQKQGGRRPTENRGGGGGRGLYDGVPSGYSSSSGESVAVAVGLVVCMICLVGFITMTGFLYADLQAARGANKHIERKVKEVIERCDRE